MKIPQVLSSRGNPFPELGHLQAIWLKPRKAVPRDGFYQGAASFLSNLSLSRARK